MLHLHVRVAVAAHHNVRLVLCDKRSSCGVHCKNRAGGRFANWPWGQVEAADGTGSSERAFHGQGVKEAPTARQ